VSASQHLALNSQETTPGQSHSVLLETLRQLRRVPTPRGMPSREIVRRAIEFDNPPRIPYYFLYHPSATDMIVIGPLDMASSGGGSTSARRGLGDTYIDRWGVTWETTGRYWDHAVGHPLADLRNLASYQPPDLLAGLRFVQWAAPLLRWTGKYIIGYNPVLMYETMRALMGFEGLMTAPYEQPEGLRRLLQLLTDKTLEAIRFYGRLGVVHGFETSEDWGLQTSLQMSMDTFRQFYRPCYQQIIDACHAQGMHFFWHNCGYIVDMFPDMIAMGVDVLQLDQPRLMGHQTLIDHLGGKVCLWNTVDIQWATSGGVSDEDIRHEVGEMARVYDVRRHRGGFMAKHYPQPWDIGLSTDRQRLIYDAFMNSGCREL
jgi:uroporphyrinogen decarboxylase